MAAVVVPSFELQTRHRGRLFVSLVSRRVRVYFSGLPLDPSSTLEITWMYCYDKEAEHPDWREVRDAKSTSPVCLGGTAEFTMMFGAMDAAHKDKSTSVMVLPRPNTRTSNMAVLTVLPLFSYVIKEVHKATDIEVHTDDLFTASGRLQMHAFWGELIFAEAVQVFTLRVNPLVSEFLDRCQVDDLLRSEWARLFMYMREPEKKKGKACEEDDEETGIASEKAIMIPRLTSELIERIIRVAYESDDVPQMISRRTFCGKSPTEGASIWRVFQNLVEMIGRSLFLRQLFNAGQLYVLRANEPVTIYTEKLEEHLVYFFRIPRSVVNEAALVIELYTTEQCPATNKITLRSVRPTPYITTSQLVRAQGNPFVAFANLDSAHHEKLSALTTKGLLQPPHLQIERLIEDDASARPIKLPVNSNALPRLDMQWWTTSFTTTSD